jgi:hypothetical protein
MPAPTCLNLRDLYGERFLIRHDPSAATWGERADPWMMTIPCRGGVTIYPHGATLLAVECDYHPGLAKRLKVIPGVRLHQDGEDEKTFLFPLEGFERLAEIVKPKRKPQYTPEQLAAFAERAKGLTPFRLAQRGKEASGEPEGVLMLQDGPEATPSDSGAVLGSRTPVCTLVALEEQKHA